MARAARKNATSEIVNVPAVVEPVEEINAEAVNNAGETTEAGKQLWTAVQNKAGEQLDSDGIKIEFDFDQFKTAAKIDEGIKSLYIVGDTARKLAHELVVASIQHYVTCGDYTRLLRMFDAVRRAMGNSRETALRAYVAANVPSLIVSDEFDGKKKIGVRLTHQKGMERTFKAAVEGKLDKPFWMLEPGTPTVEFDFVKLMRSLLKRSISAAEKVGNHKAGDEVRNDKGELVQRISADYDNITPEQARQIADTLKIDLTVN